MGKIIDHTIRKREQTTKRLMRCPACGMIGHKGVYKDGTIRFHHVLEVKQLGRLGAVAVVKDSCYIPVSCQSCQELSSSKVNECWMDCQIIRPYSLSEESF